MCGFIATHPTKIDCVVVRSQQAFVRQRSRHSRNFPCATGWGAAYYQDGEPVIDRRVISPYDDFLFDATVASTPSQAMIVHVRTGTIGRPERKNTHPFQHQLWTYAQAGTIENFYTLRRELMGELNPEYRRSIHGATDAEHVFYLFLSYLKRSAGSIGGDAPIHRMGDSLQKTVLMLNEMTGRSGSGIQSGFSLVLTNLQVLIAYRQGQPFFYVERSHAAVCTLCGESHVALSSDSPYRAVLVASEPFSGEEWKEIPDEHMVVVDPDLSASVIPVHEPPQSE
jgi:glutamine amidotransferase